MIEKIGQPVAQRDEDVLQNIEFSIIQMYRLHRELTDWEVLEAIEGLIRFYGAEAKGHQARLPALHGLAQQVYESAQAMCEWRLGREKLIDTKSKRPMVIEHPLSVDEILLCLKRIRKSINLWLKERSRQGYLTFVSQFLP